MYNRTIFFNDGIQKCAISNTTIDNWKVIFIKTLATYILSSKKLALKLPLLLFVGAELMKDKLDMNIKWFYVFSYRYLHLVLLEVLSSRLNSYHSYYLGFFKLWAVLIHLYHMLVCPLTGSFPSYSHDISTHNPKH